MDQNTLLDERVYGILFPHAARRTAEALRKGTRFVHYSSAEAAMKVLSGRQMWMRKATLMNDFMEIEHGWMCVTSAIVSGHPMGGRLRRALDEVVPGFSADIDAGWGQWR